jgi:ankyrin repeat protein
MNQFVKAQRNKTKEAKSSLQKYQPKKVDRMNEAKYIAENYPHLASVPDFNMSDFQKANAFTLHTARELLMILLEYGLDVNYHRESDGLSPVHYAVRHKNSQLLALLMKIKTVDVNFRARFTQNEPVNSKYYHK